MKGHNPFIRWDFFYQYNRYEIDGWFLDGFFINIQLIFELIIYTINLTYNVYYLTTFIEKGYFLKCKNWLTYASNITIYFIYYNTLVKLVNINFLTCS
jgi:hypothetical protein